MLVLYGVMGNVRFVGRRGAAVVNSCAAQGRRSDSGATNGAAFSSVLRRLGETLGRADAAVAAHHSLLRLRAGGDGSGILQI